MPEVEPVDPGVLQEHGSEIGIGFDEGTNISSLSDHATTWRQWEAILRLFTAAGFFDFDEDDPFLNLLRISLLVIQEDGTGEQNFVGKGYLFPHKIAPANIRLSGLERNEQGSLPQRNRDMDVLWEFFPKERVAELVADRMENVPYLRVKKREAFSHPS